MAGKKATLDIAANKDGTFTLRAGSKTRDLTFEEMFAYGHSCLNAKKYATALRVFKVLGKAHSADRQVRIMQARCEACLDHFSACQEALEAAFDDPADETAEKLHSVFVYENVRMLPEAIHDLTQLVTDFSDQPAACLILGDLLASVGEADKAASCWRLAVKRDQPGGPVATAATTQIARLKKKADP